MYLIFENEQPWVRCTLKVAQGMNPELMEPSGHTAKSDGNDSGAYLDTNPVPPQRPRVFQEAQIPSRPSEQTNAW